MNSDKLRPIYDYNRPIGELYEIFDIFVYDTEININTGREDVKGISLVIGKNGEIADWEKENYFVITVTENQLENKNFIVEPIDNNICEIIKNNYSEIEKAYKTYIKEIKKRYKYL